MDWGTFLGNLAGYSLAGNQLSQDERKRKAEALAAENEAGAFVPGNVALATIFNMDPDDPALDRYRNVQFPAKYLGQVGSFGLKSEEAGTEREVRPGKVRGAEESANAFAELAYQRHEQGRGNAAEADISEGQKPFKIQESKGKADLATTNAGTAQQTQPFVTQAAQEQANKLRAQIQEISARTDLTEEEKKTEIGKRQGEIALLNQKVQTEQATTGLRQAQTEAEKSSGGKSGSKTNLRNEAINAYKAEWGSDPLIRPKNAPSMEAYIENYIRKYGGEGESTGATPANVPTPEKVSTAEPSAPPPEVLDKTTAKKDPQYFADYIIRNALVGNKRGSLRQGIKDFKAQKGYLAQNGVPVALVEAILRLRAKNGNADYDAL